MTSDNKKCVFACKYDHKVIAFNKEKLQKCHEVLKVRIAFDLRYKEIILPKTVTQDHGYHTMCCKNFLAINKVYVEEFKNQQAGTSSCISHASTSGNAIAIDESMLVDDPGTHSQPPQPASVSTSDLSSSATTSDEKVLEPMQLSAASIEVEDESNITASEEDICFICGKSRVRKHLRALPLFSSNDTKLLNDLRSNANAIGDSNMIEKIDSLRPEEIIHYHAICKMKYLTKHKYKNETVQTTWHECREFHEIAFNRICNFVQEKVIDRRECVMQSVICEMYNKILEEYYMEAFDSSDAAVRNNRILDKLVGHYGDAIQILFVHKKKIIAPRDKNISDEIFQKLQESETLQRAAAILRKKFLNISRKPLPDCMKVSDLLEGECVIPSDLLDFFKTILCGNDLRTQQSCNCARIVDSIVQDMIYNIHHGKIKTPKHIALGMTLKSITSSRKVIDLINKFGHCCSYSAIEELETEATFYSCSKSNVCPENIVLSGNYCTGVAYDNYDRFVETCSGKDTLHDTVGILYQNDSEINNADSETDDIDEQTCSRKRRRTLDVVLPELVSYNKTPKLRENLLPLNSPLRNIDASSFDIMKKLDLLWVFSHSCKIPNTPMWVGFNSLLVQDNSKKQKIAYLNPINLSPTDKSVVYETLRQSQQIAHECNQPHMQITYDLAIAKLAYQIQCEEKPKLDNLFIHMGAFHIMLAYFKAVGKFIDDCGLSHIMVESELLASGSVNGFISGKHFNRCKRLHPLVALGLQILHVEEFLKEYNIIINEDITEALKQLQSEQSLDAALVNEKLSEILSQYLEYREKTLNGEYGKTAKFYMMYIQFINYYLMFSRSIRTGDFSLYKYIIPKLSNIFFINNQTNYARWLLKYHDNLLKVEETHPQLAEDFEKGMFGIKRTDKKFSRIPIDLTLEQTVNADAARRLTGITHFTNSIAARQRWAKSHSIRSTIIGKVYEMTGLKRNQDVSSELESHQIKKDNLHLQKFISEIKNNINPFNMGIDQNTNYLYNISTGRCATDEVTEFLLNIEKNGEIQRNNFILECANCTERFERPIKKNKIMNFSSSHEKKKMKVNNKVIEVRLQRDLFGRMLGISMEGRTDIQKILSYPITPVPMSLCNVDGSICKTEKSALMKCLVIESGPPSYTDELLIDGFFVLHCMKDVPKTFGGISKKILQIITSTKASRIHIIFDRYCSPSIKDYERSMRGRTIDDREYIISGPQQTRPADFFKELRNDKFKTALVTFLVTHWESNEFAPFIGRKVILLDHIYCFKYEVGENDQVIKTNDYTFFCPLHEEADTKIVFHATRINSDCNITIKCSDTDILIIMLANLHHMKSQSTVWIEFGVSTHRRTINVNEIYKNLGEDLCKAMPAFHAFTGCDFNPAFFRKGKLRPFKILCQSETFKKAFSELSSESCDDESLFETLQSYVSNLYGFKSKNANIPVNTTRFELFLKNYKTKHVNEPFNKKILKNFDASSLPPCESELRQHFLRTKYIAYIWSHAYMEDLTEFEPENFGWKCHNNEYLFKWFDGPQLPSSVKEVMLDFEENEAEDTNEEYNSDSDEDSQDESTEYDSE